MAEITTVARPYAKAAFEFARASGQLAGWSSMLALVAAVVEDGAFRQYIERPTLSAAQQADAVLKACGNALDVGVCNFVHYVAANKRLPALPAIRAQFETLRAESEGAIDVEVTTAFALDDAQTQSLAKTLSSKLSRDVTIASVVDVTLIGGAVIRAGDTVIDASVRGKLGQLSATLNS